MTVKKLKNHNHVKFVNRLVRENKTPAQVVKSINPSLSKDACYVQGTRLMQNKDIRQALSEKLDSIGLSINNTNNKLLRMTEAKKEIVLQSKNGTDIIEVRDNPTQLEAIKTAYKLHGVLGNNNSVSVDNRQINFNIDDESVEKLQKAIKNLNEIANQHKLEHQTGEVEDASLLED